MPLVFYSFTTPNTPRFGFLEEVFCHILKAPVKDMGLVYKKYYTPSASKVLFYDCPPFFVCTRVNTYLL